MDEIERLLAEAQPISIAAGREMADRWRQRGRPAAMLALLRKHDLAGEVAAAVAYIEILGDG